MASSPWQKQNIHLSRVVWAVSAIISLLLITLFLWLGFRIEVAGVIFIGVFAILRVLLAFIFNNRFANAMVRILKFDYEEIQRDFLLLFKEHHIQYKQKTEVDAYCYEFPWRKLSMIVQPYWRSNDKEPVTKVTLYELTPKNEEFAGRLAEAIDEMANHLENT